MLFLNIILIIFVLLYIPVFIFLLYSVYVMFKGAPYVPTNKKRVQKMIELADLKKHEKLIDLGSGDGRIVFQAAKTGADCIGIELNPVLYYLSLLKAKLFGLKNVKFKRQDLWTIDLSDTDVLTLYFIDNKMEKLKRKIQKEMKPGARIISHAFTFPGWPYEKKDGKIYLYKIKTPKS